MRHSVHSVATRCLAFCLCLLAAAGCGHASVATFKKVLFVGDSITQHLPNSSLGWSGSWGMAASAVDKDYVHLFLKKLTENQGSAPESLVMARGGGTVAGQLQATQEMTDFHPDLAIVQMGENDRDVSDSGFRQPYAKILAAIRDGNSNVSILCLGVWGPPDGSPEKDAMIQQASRDAHATFVNIRALNEDLRGQAKTENLFTNVGVNWHPSDFGMAGYAATLWKALSDPSAAADPPSGGGGSGGIETTVVKEDWNGGSQVAWLPNRPSVELQDGVRAAKFTNAKEGGSNVVEWVIVPTTIAGKWVTVETRVKGEDISTRPAPYNGAKISFHLHNAESKDDYPQVHSLPDGTFDWQEIKWHLRIPENVVSAEFGIGLEKVKGTLWVAPLTITAQS